MLAISSPGATRSSRREKWVFASKEPTVSMRPRGLAGGLSRYADECWVVAAAVTGRAGTSGQRMPRRRRVRWLPDNRLGGRIAGQGVQVALHSSGRGLFTHEKNPLPRWHPRGFYRVPCPPATLSKRGRGGARLVVTRQGRSKRMESRMARTSGFNTASAFSGSPCGCGEGSIGTVIGMTDRHPHRGKDLCQVNRRVDASRLPTGPVAAS